MSEGLPVDALALREEVKAKYRAVAVDPHGSYHFHTGRPLARRLGYDEAVVAVLPDRAVEAFAGVGNPFSLESLKPGERVIDLGCGGRLRLLYRGRPGWARRARGRRRHDGGNARPVAYRGGRHGPVQCRVPA